MVPASIPIKYMCMAANTSSAIQGEPARNPMMQLATADNAEPKVIMRARPRRNANSLPLTLAIGPRRKIKAAETATETVTPSAPLRRPAAKVRKATSHERVACNSHEWAAVAKKYGRTASLRSTGRKSNNAGRAAGRGILRSRARSMIAAAPTGPALATRKAFRQPKASAIAPASSNETLAPNPNMAP